MSIRKRISIENAILQAVDNSSDIYLKEKPVLMKWAKQSFIRINGYASTIPAICYTTVDQVTAPVPDNAVMISLIFLGHIDLQLGQYGNAQMLFDILERNVNHTSINGVQSVIRELFKYSTGSSIRTTGIPWQIQNNKIVFDINLDKQELTIIYLKLESDEFGYPWIEEEQVEAIGKFIEMKLTERENSHKFLRGTLRNPDLQYAQVLNRTYHYLVAKSRPSSTPSEDLLVARMINNPWTGSSVI